MTKTIDDRIAELQALRSLAIEYGYGLVDASEQSPAQPLAPTNPRMTKTDPSDEEVRKYVSEHPGEQIDARTLCHKLGFYNPKHVKHISHIIQRSGGRRLMLNGGGPRMRRNGCDVYSLG